MAADMPGGHLAHPQRLLDASPDALLTLTHDGRVLSWNRGAASMYGFTPQEAIGRQITDLLVPEELHRAGVRAPT